MNSTRQDLKLWVLVMLCKIDNWVSFDYMYASVWANFADVNEDMLEDVLEELMGEYLIRMLRTMGDIRDNVFITDEEFMIPPIHREYYNPTEVYNNG